MEYTIAARPTTYKGIEMRSRLEARFAELLDALGIRWEYEPRCYADETGQYLPDFTTFGWHLPAYADQWGTSIGGRINQPTFFEVKPFLPDDHMEPGGLEDRMRIIRSSHPRAGLYIWMPPEWDCWGVMALPTEPHFGVSRLMRCRSCRRPHLACDWRTASARCVCGDSEWESA